MEQQKAGTVEVEPYLRVADVAREWGIPRDKVVLMFARRPGVVRLPTPRLGRYLLLIPPASLEDVVWVDADLAKEYRVPLGVVIATFAREPGTWMDGDRLMIPETIRLRVFKRRANK